MDLCSHQYLGIRWFTRAVRAFWSRLHSVCVPALQDVHPCNEKKWKDIMLQNGSCETPRELQILELYRDINIQIDMSSVSCQTCDDLETVCCTGYGIQSSIHSPLHYSFPLFKNRNSVWRRKNRGKKQTKSLKKPQNKAEIAVVRCCCVFLLLCTVLGLDPLQLCITLILLKFSFFGFVQLFFSKTCKICRLKSQTPVQTKCSSFC